MVTLIFISGRDSAISSVKKVNRVLSFLYLFCKELISCLSRANVSACHVNPGRLYPELTFVNA